MKLKFSITVIIFIIVINFISPVFATDSTPSAAQDLLDRVATKVATLVSKLRRVYTGQIKSIGTRSIVVTTSEGDRTVTTNDITSFFKIRAGNRTEINFTTLKVSDDIAAIGTVDPNTFEMTTKQIIVKVRRYNVVGTIVSVDKTILSIQELFGPTTKIDFSDALSLKTIKTDGTITSARLSTFKTDDLVFIIGYLADPKDEALSVLKALRLEK